MDAPIASFQVTIIRQPVIQALGLPPGEVPVRRVFAVRFDDSSQETHFLVDSPAMGTFTWIGANECRAR
jgi:hypothetical protein